MSGKGYEPDLEVQSAMAGYLERAVVGTPLARPTVTGASASRPRCAITWGRWPRSTPPSGGAAPARERDANSLGMEFEVTDPWATVELRAVASCYYKVFPTLEEQLRFDGGRDDPAVRPGREYRLAPVFKRVEVDSGAVKVRLEPGKPLVKNIGLDELALEFQRAQTAVARNPEVERRDGEDRSERRVPGDVLTDERLFARWLAELGGTPVLPEWRASMTLLARPAQGGATRVALSFENLSEDPTVAARRSRRGSDRRHDDARDHFLFRSPPGGRRGGRRRSPRSRWTSGPTHIVMPRNCPRTRTTAGSRWSGTGPRRSCGWPRCPRPSMRPTAPCSNPHPSCSFDVLAGEDALPALRTFAADMRAYLGHEDWDTSDLERTRPDLAERKRQDRSAFDLEVRRFEDGIRWLERDPRLLLAFRLANRTMLKLGEMSRRTHPGWRRFQLVFIVSQLPALAWREHDPAEFTADLWGDPAAGTPLAPPPCCGTRPAAGRRRAVGSDDAPRCSMTGPGGSGAASPRGAGCRCGCSRSSRPSGSSTSSRPPRRSASVPSPSCVRSAGTLATRSHRLLRLRGQHSELHEQGRRARADDERSGQAAESAPGRRVSLLP